jgi:hypothetical protein
VTAITFLIEQIAVGLYIFIGVLIFMQFRRWIRAGQELRAANFDLERDFAREQRSSAFFMMVIFLEIGLLVVGIQNIVAPILREDQQVIQAIAAVDPARQIIADGDGIFVTNTPPAVIQPPGIDDSDIELGVDAMGVIFVTPTPTFTPVGTIEANAPPPIGCNSPNATLQIPANGMRVFQITPIRGTAFADNFVEFRLEIAGPQTLNQYAPFHSDPNQSPELSTLAQFNPVGYQEGTYRFRLQVFDTTQLAVASCEVTIYITDPIPTATPLAP